MKLTQALKPHISHDDLTKVAESANAVVGQAKSNMFAPDKKKKPPMFNKVQLGALCSLDQNKVTYHLKKGTLPAGTKETTRVMWSLAEARQWAQKFRVDFLREREKTSAVTIAVAIFKGGAAKTSTAAALAQGLSLRGHKVLLVDTDPQGSLTTLFDYMPNVDVSEEHTALPICAGDSTSILDSVRPTYWDGLDIVCAGPVLYNAEFILPSRQKAEAGFEFWRVLDAGLESARDVYDVIIIDTPPALSYVTINALIAADGVIMPLPPSALDFASSAQFWNLFTEICSGLFTKSGANKKYYFLDVLLSKVDKADIVSSAVRQWILAAYGKYVIPVEIPKTSIAATASAEFGTVYDLSSTSAQAKTLKRAKDAYEQLVDYIEMQLIGIWTNDIEKFDQPA